MCVASFSVAERGAVCGAVGCRRGVGGDGGPRGCGCLFLWGVARLLGGCGACVGGSLRGGRR